MMFGDSNIAAIAVYTVMFVLGLAANSLSLFQLTRARLLRWDRSRMTLLLIHLSVADLLVGKSHKLLGYNVSLGGS